MIVAGSNRFLPKPPIKPMVIAASILVISLAAPQSTLVREVESTRQEQSSDVVIPGVVGSPEVSDFLTLDRPVGLLGSMTGAIPGVEFAGLELSVSLDTHLDLEVLGVESGLTTLTPAFSVAVRASDSTGNWGPIDGYTFTDTLWNGVPPMIGAGETYVYDDVVYSDSGSWSCQPGQPCFQSVLQFPQFEILMAPTVELPTQILTGPADVEVVRMALTTTIELELKETFELAEQPVTSYCTSPANSTGATASLTVYGSPAAGSQWLSVEVTDLPEQAAAVLFMADAPASVPLGTANLCVGGAIRRAGGLQVVTQNSAVFDVDLEGTLPGEEVHFQVLHRDPSLGLAASEGVRLTVQ